MSEANEGELPSKRPGTNAGAENRGNPNGSPQSRPKNRKRRWNRRGKKQQAGVQADNLTTLAKSAGGPDVSSGAVNPRASGQETESNPSQSAPDNEWVSPFSGEAKGKRAKRRGKRGRGGKKPGPGGMADAAAAKAGVGAKTDLEAGIVNGSTVRQAGNGAKSIQTQAEADAVRSADTSSSRNRRNGAKPAKSQGAGRKGAQVGRAERRQVNASAKRPDAYAALDLGTNNCRLLIAVPQQPGRFRVVDAFSRIVRLGEGLASSGRLSEQAMDRAVGALKACADKLANRDVRGVRLIATEACRQAENGKEFLDRVRAEAGLDLELIDRETEAQLAVAGCASLVDRKARGVVLFDIGGGSSELALLDLNKRNRYDLRPAMVSWMSLPLGVVTLSEKHGGGKLVTRQVFDNMVAEVARLLEGFEGRNALSEAACHGEIHLLGTSGTVTTLAGIHLKLPRYDRRVVDGTWMNSNDITSMINALVDMSFEERVANPCIGRDRADLVLAGCAILVAIQRMWPCPRLRVADRGLREGLLTEMMNADNAWQRQPRRRPGR